MRALLALFLTISTAVPATAEPVASEPSTSPTIAFDGGQWFDGTAFVPAIWYSVAGRLTATAPERIDVRIDLTDRYVLPPLADAHNHDLQNARFGAISNAKNLRAGVFYSLQMCSKPAERGAFTGFLNNPGMMDVAYVDACISSSDGHPLGIALASDRQMGLEADVAAARKGYDPIDSLADLDRSWPEIVARKPEIIKIILVNSEHRARDAADPALFGFLGLAPELVAPIVERAHAAGIRVAAHADSAGDFAVAVAAGADIIAHLPGYRIARTMTIEDYRLSDEAIAEARRRGTIVITTAAIASNGYQRDPETREPIRAMQTHNLTRLREAGVALAIGSDLVMGTVVDEILYLDGLDIMPRAELLNLATAATPAMMFPGRAIGAFVEGGEASLIAYDENALVDLDALKRPGIIVKQGSLLSLRRDDSKQR